MIYAISGCLFLGFGIVTAIAVYRERNEKKAPILWGQIDLFREYKKQLNAVRNKS
jgi:hypothetical protein